MIAWNCRGAGSSAALRHLILLVRSHKPHILILAETKISSNFILNIYTKTHFNDCLVSEVIGFYGGIWILWDNTKLRIDIMSLDT